MSRVFSTRELAALCGVNESTIKRWADSGQLACVKTPGGHRKFKMPDVLDFLNKHGFDSTSLTANAYAEAELPPHFDVLIRNGDDRALAESYVQAALTGSHAAVRAIIMKLLSHELSPIHICDQVVEPALDLVGERWSQGSLSIIEEHLISAATLEGLSTLSREMPRGEPRHKHALCCPIDGDLHNIGVQMTALALESIGWSASASASSAPMDEIAAYVEQHRPDLLCLSVIYAPLDDARRPALTGLREVSQRCGTRVAIGGRGVAGAVELPCDFHGTSLAGLVAWVKETGLDAPAEAAARSPHAGTN